MDSTIPGFDNTHAMNVLVFHLACLSFYGVLIWRYVRHTRDRLPLTLDSSIAKAHPQQGLA